MFILEYIDIIAILTIAIVFIPVERLIPLHKDQKTLRKNWVNDVVYLIFNRVPIQIGTIFQLIEVLLIADTGFYFAHRMFHAVPFLWRFHAVHHSIEELDWLAAHRVHPVDQITTTFISLAPIFVLGFSDASVLIFALVYQWHSLLIHANVKINFGPLKWVVSSPQFHHWHHANQREAYDKNFSAQLPFIDRLFGTMFLPKEFTHPDRYGTDDPVPNFYHKQFLYPFLRALKSGQENTSESENISNE